MNLWCGEVREDFPGKDSHHSMEAKSCAKSHFLICSERETDKQIHGQRLSREIGLIMTSIFNHVSRTDGKTRILLFS
jgi:hypothetical protein